MIMISTLGSLKKIFMANAEIMIRVYLSRAMIQRDNAEDTERKIKHFYSAQHPSTDGAWESSESIKLII